MKIAGSKNDRADARRQRLFSTRRAVLLERGMDKIYRDACMLHEKSEQLLRMAEKEKLRLNSRSS